MPYSLVSPQIGYLLWPPCPKIMSMFFLLPTFYSFPCPNPSNMSMILLTLGPAMTPQCLPWTFLLLCVPAAFLIQAPYFLLCHTEDWELICLFTKTFGGVASSWNPFELISGQSQWITQYFKATATTKKKKQKNSWWFMWQPSPIRVQVRPDPGTQGWYQDWFSQSFSSVLFVLTSNPESLSYLCSSGRPISSNLATTAEIEKLPPDSYTANPNFSPATWLPRVITVTRETINRLGPDLLCSWNQWGQGQPALYRWNRLREECI